MEPGVVGAGIGVGVVGAAVVVVAPVNAVV